MTHPNPAALARYADREADLDEVTTWSIEVHLETCADCRAVLAADTDPLLLRVAAGLDAAIAAGPPPAPRRRLSVLRHHWFVGALVPWLTMTVAVLGCAALLMSLQPSFPSLVLLLAPVAPLPAVAVAWSRRFDPAWELIAGTPGAGLAMLLRRTAAVLAVIIPALALASTGTDASLAVALVPCLAFTSATIALGAFAGVRRAAIGLGAAWTLFVIAPAFATATLPAVLQPGSTPVWGLITLALAGLAAARAGNFHRLTSHQ